MFRKVVIGLLVFGAIMQAIVLLITRSITIYTLVWAVASGVAVFSLWMVAAIDRWILHTRMKEVAAAAATEETA